MKTSLTAAKEAGRYTIVRYDICFITELSRTVATVISCIRLLSAKFTVAKAFPKHIDVSRTLRIASVATYQVHDIPEPVIMHTPSFLKSFYFSEKMVALFSHELLALLAMLCRELGYQSGVRCVHDETDRFAEVL